MNGKKEGIGSEAFWLRVIFMLLFFVAYQVAELILGGIILLQVVYTALTGERNVFLQQAGAAFSEYSYQVYRYLTYNRDEKPFPFSAWPTGEAPDKDPYQPDQES